MSTKILSGRLAVGVAGTATQGPDTGNISSGFYVTFPKLNTGTYVFLGNPGTATTTDVSSTDLFVLEEGSTLYFEEGRIENMNELWFVAGSDSSSDGTDYVCWLTG